MRDFPSCFSEYAVQISDSASCSSNANNSFISPSLTPSIQDSVTCLYRTILSDQKQYDFRVTWSKNSTVGQGLSICFVNYPSTPFKLNTNSRLFRKKKGSKYIEQSDCKIEVFWDLSAAKYQTGPEPMEGYYVLVTIDSDIVIILGDLAEESTCFKKVNKIGNTETKFLLISRQEHFSGNTYYSTKAQFFDNGIAHDLMIRCSGGDNEGLKHNPVLSVNIDNKEVIRVKRLQWNFRGNQTIFLDGLLIDLMWDVHDWFFKSANNGSAVFMFRTRTGIESRLWLLEDENLQKNQEKYEFSFMVYACRCP